MKIIIIVVDYCDKLHKRILNSLKHHQEIIHLHPEEMYQPRLEIIKIVEYMGRYSKNTNDGKQTGFFNKRGDIYSTGASLPMSTQFTISNISYKFIVITFISNIINIVKVINHWRSNSYITLLCLFLIIAIYNLILNS